MILEEHSAVLCQRLAEVVKRFEAEVGVSCTKVEFWHSANGDIECIPHFLHNEGKPPT